MIMKWNRKVQKNDEVVIIGDFSFGNSEETISLLHRLNGKLFLIQGNHDKFLNTSVMQKYDCARVNTLCKLVQCIAAAGLVLRVPIHIGKTPKKRSISNGLPRFCELRTNARIYDYEMES